MRKQSLARKILFLAVLTLGIWQVSFYQYWDLPQQNLAFVGEQLAGASQNPFVDTVVTDSEGRETQSFDQAGNYNVSYEFMGVVPVASQEYQVVPDLQVVPGGQAVGILLHTQGASVVGYAPVTLADGSTCSPAQQQGILVGDFILEVDGRQVDTDEQVGEAAQAAGEAGRDLQVKLLRDGQEQTMALTPQFCYDTNSYRVGMYIRDNTAGVGTLTYYHPESGTYGALGHMVGTDGEVVSQEGNILGAQIQSIKAGVKGEPGEKIGVFAKSSVEGTIEKNTVLGIFGHLEADIENSCFEGTVPVATADKIQEGPAQIITVLENDTLETFDIEISRLMVDQQASGKGMIIKVTDPDLLARTGGIVQGMSGSPIMQNGYLVGAVSHVFVNDPTKGYGCLAEWMIMEGISTNNVEISGNMTQ